MPRLKSRTKWPPYGFQLLLPEIGMKEPVIGSFQEVVEAFARAVRKNPAIAQKYNWPSDRRSQEDFVDEREAQRMIAQGWESFVEFGSFTRSVPPPLSTTLGSKKNWRNVAAAVVDGGKAAASSYASMFGPNGKPVARELAEQRAAVCAACPQNDIAGGIASHFLEATAKSLMTLLGALKDMDVTVSMPERLGVCKSCMCPMLAKVFVPKQVIIDHMPQAVWPLLQQENPRCWILNERDQ